MAKKYGEIIWQKYMAKIYGEKIWRKYGEQKTELGEFFSTNSVFDEFRFCQVSLPSNNIQGINE